ncbi:MAG TPA: ABC transporter permease subunit, partial [Bacteroidota bacterium]|nr:ABC transporter permease subunit [Bacteroidota bacterium]
GLQSFTRTSASLLNLVLYIVPLVALTMGTLSFSADKGSLELLFSQPVSRAEVMLGKWLGVFLSLALSTLVGFFLAGTIIVASSGVDGLAPYISFVVLSIALSGVFLSLAVLVSTASKRRFRVFGYALFVWFFYVLFYDLLAIGCSILLRGQSANAFLFLSLFGNPVDLVRVATLIMLDNAEIFGVGGAAMLRFLGGQTASLVLLSAALLVWVGAPLLFSSVLLRRQDF